MIALESREFVLSEIAPQPGLIRVQVQRGLVPIARILSKSATLLQSGIDGPQIGVVAINTQRFLDRLVGFPALFNIPATSKQRSKLPTRLDIQPIGGYARAKNANPVRGITGRRPERGSRFRREEGIGNQAPQDQAGPDEESADVG